MIEERTTVIAEAAKTAEKPFANWLDEPGAFRAGSLPRKHEIGRAHV